jgi:hypothetical protein
MGIQIPLGAYLAWHYGQAYRDIGTIWRDILWFLYHFFSLPLLGKTFFSPLFRLRERVESFNAESILEAVLVTTIMRIFGMILRAILFVIGISSLALVCILGVFLYVVWTLLPFLILGFFVVGSVLLFL